MKTLCGFTVPGDWWPVADGLVMHDKVRSFKELRAWQCALGLVDSVYRLSADFPANETYGLEAQLLRAAVSIPSNIAEGQTRTSTKELLNHLSSAQGSLAELETQLEISVRLGYLKPEPVAATAVPIESPGKRSHALREALEARR